MKITRPSCEIPVRNHCDVLVVGAGPAGIGAAISAARAGAKVSLVEYGGKLGGMWTLGLLSPFFDNRHHRGLNEEIRTHLQERQAWGGLWDISFDPTQMALLLDELVLAEKIDVLLYSIASEPIMEDGVIQGVTVVNKSGTQAILAKVLIDCSGDGDIAARAGAPYVIGRPDNGAFQPMTMLFKIGGVKEEYPRDDIIGFYRAICKEAPEEQILKDVPYNYPAIIKLPRPGEALIQWTHVRRLLGCDGDQLSQATFEGRLQLKHAMRYLQMIKPVLGEVHLLELPAVIGVRESRRITGDYIVSDEDVKTGKKHPDNVCSVRFGVDIHEPDEAKQTCWSHPGFDIPYRALLPLQVENLLTAGRCISGSYSAHAAYRVTGNCLAMGEAAGKAAAQAIKEGCSVRQLASKGLQDAQA
jgi:hypothetical protein